MRFPEFAVWILGIGLELLLLLLVLFGGTYRRFPVFTLTLTFYIVRGLALFMLFGALSRTSYTALYDALWVVDYGIRILLIGEITFHALLERGESRTRCTLAAAGIVAASALGMEAIGFFLRQWLPGSRDDLVIAIVACSLLLWMIVKGIRGVVRRIAEGLAFFQLVMCSASYLQRYSSVHRNASLWASASWAKSLAWIAVTAVWLLALWSRRETPALPGRADLRSV